MTPTRKISSLRVLAALSLALNAAFIWGIWGGLAAEPTDSKAGAAASDLPPMAASNPANVHLRSSPNGTANNAGAAEWDGLWSRIGTDDLDALIERLRAAGFPTKSIRTVVFAILNHRTSEKRDELLGRTESAPYWQPAFYSAADPVAREKLSEYYSEVYKLRRRYTEMLEEPPDENEIEEAQRLYGSVPLAKMNRIRWLTEDSYTRQEETVRELEKKPGGLSDAMRQKLYTKFQLEREAATAQLLTPQELEDYELRQSSRANLLRSRLELFQPTEAEYKAIFALQTRLERQFDRNDPNQSEAYRTALEQMKPEFEAALGRERYADYVQTQQSTSDKLSRLVARLELPLATVGKVNAVRDDITQRAKAVRENAQLTDAQRAQQLSVLAEEAGTRLTTTLGGARGYDAYQDIKGDWIRALTAPPKK